MKTISNKNNDQDDETNNQKILILITSEHIGSGDDVLGEKLMINYIKSLKEMESSLWQIIFVNGGVHLVTDLSPVITELQDYQKDKITILSCGTCLKHFGLESKVAVGETTNMLDIVSGIHFAEKVITIG